MKLYGFMRNVHKLGAAELEVRYSLDPEQSYNIQPTFQ
jgi:hypothetical protein